MRVIKQGKKPEEEVFQATCGNCKTVVEFARGEAKYESDQRERSSWLEVICPTCGHRIIRYLEGG